MCKKKLISVIIPTYGRPEFLSRAIESVLNQSYTNTEVIIVDDNTPNSKSRLETEQLIKSFDDHKNVLYVKHSQNKRVGAARNTGIYLAKGDYISFLDDDDEFFKDKLETQVRFLESNKIYNGCYCRYESFSNNKLTRKSTYIEQGDLTLDVYKFLCTGNASCYMFKKDTLLELKGFNENLSRHEDFELLVRYFESNLMGFVNIYGVKRHTDSRINMPTVESYIEIKKTFFSAIEKNLNKLSASEIKDVRNMHKADIFFYCLRKKSFSQALINFPGIIASTNYLIVKIPNIREIVKRNFIIKKT